MSVIRSACVGADAWFDILRNLQAGKSRFDHRFSLEHFEVWGTVFEGGVYPVER